MERSLRAIATVPELRATLARSGVETIRARHTCAHRVDELLGILRRLERPQLEAAG
jgi:spore maturation protein CgeB